MEEVKSFLKEKSQIKYHIVNEEQYDIFHEKIKKYQERHLYTHDRKFIFAVQNNEVIGLAILLDAEKDIEPLKNTLMLTNIEVKSNKRNNGIASNLIDIALNEVKKENKDKMKILYEVANNMIKENNIEKIEDIKFYMTEEAEKSIENVFSGESNKATKRKKRKPA